MSEITMPASKGITAQAARATVKVMIGASRKMPLFAAVGMMVSWRNTLSPSAKDWSKPKGPTTLGPRRIMIAPSTLREITGKLAAGEISRSEAVNRLVDAVVAEGPGRVLGPRQREALRAHLNQTLADDPVLGERVRALHRNYRIPISNTASGLMLLEPVA